MTWEGLTPPYATIVADPPWDHSDGWPGWSQRSQRTKLSYSSMTIEKIKALPVAELSQREGYLFLWTTNRFLEAGFGVLRSWGFNPRQVVVWCKPPRGEGPGGMFATTTEFVLIGQNIKPGTNAHGRRTMGTRIDRSWFEWPRGPHSVKPPAFYDILEQVTPAPRVELFARQARLGWDSWGFGFEQVTA